MDTVRQGNQGFQVEFLQRLINKALRRDRAAGTPLVEDGRFGPRTDAAVRAFQGRHRPLVDDGVAGSNTWRVLGVRTSAEHMTVQVFGQPSTTSCWSAAATMILRNMSAGGGDATIDPGGGLEGSTENIERFAQSLGWHMLDHTPTVGELVSLVQRTPVWINGTGPNWAHAVVLSGVYSDGDASGDGTMFRVHDPWPVGIGKIYGSFANPICIMSASGVSRVPASLDAVMYP